MRVFSVAGIEGREFSDRLLRVSDLKAWTAQQRCEIPLSAELRGLEGFDFVNVAALLGGIGNALLAQTPEAEREARAIVAAHPQLAADPAAEIAPRWLAADHARKEWRAAILAGVEAGALVFLDLASKLPFRSSTGATVEHPTKPETPVPPVSPLPIPTRELAECFAGLGGKNAQQWMKPMGYPPRWLKGAVHTRGLRGVSETLWDPVALGAALVKRGVKQNSVRARFQTMPPLKPWLDAWKTYEAEYLATE